MTAYASPRTNNAHNSDIRTFRAANTRAALAAIKAALGSDAVILDTREVGGLFGRPEIEVTVAPPALPLVDTSPSDADARSKMEDEIARLRREIATLRAGTPASAPGAGAPGRAGLYGRLIRRGVEEDVAFALLREAERAGGANPAELEDELMRVIKKRLTCAPAPWLPLVASGHGPRVMALVGPTGVGKTTTVAKIAARALLEGHLKVALITVDVYRIGASDQLARYGRIMGVPTYVAKDEAALAEAVGHSRDMDLVLVDTAGRSDQTARNEQAKLLRSVAGIELHLVLSAATGGREIGAMAQRYAALTPQQIVFSKVDESEGPGCILSATSALPRPIACIADGQRVPEDIHTANARDLSKLVLGK